MHLHSLHGGGLIRPQRTSSWRGGAEYGPIAYHRSGVCASGVCPKAPTDACQPLDLQHEVMEFALTDLPSPPFSYPIVWRWLGDDGCARRAARTSGPARSAVDRSPVDASRPIVARRPSSVHELHSAQRPAVTSGRASRQWPLGVLSCSRTLATLPAGVLSYSRSGPSGMRPHRPQASGRRPVCAVALSRATWTLRPPKLSPSRA
jgi:hypothetical protein